MADGIAPAIDKVGAPEPTAPEAQANAPTLDTTTVPPSAQPSEPAKTEEEKNIEEGAGPAVAAPKPVEVMSVPETPINNQTPAGGTPRPELNVEEPKEDPKEEEAVMIEGLQEEEATNGPKDEESIADKIVEKVTNGATKVAEMTGALPESGDKRKAEEPATNGDVVMSDKPDSEERSGKKARVEDAAESAPATNGKPGPGRPKKKEKAPAVGKTLRKTRSQGPVEL
ncbi:Fc.00g071830.m01.CDS01 [Cosmosporella sp. VM-42]